MSGFPALAQNYAVKAHDNLHYLLYISPHVWLVACRYSEAVPSITIWQTRGFPFNGEFFYRSPIFARVLAILLCLTGALAIFSLPVEQ